MPAERQGHSSSVQIRLEVAGQVLSVAQVGEDSLILRETCQLGKSLGKIVIAVDGQFSEHSVLLLHGISLDSRVVRFCDVDGGASQASILEQQGDGGFVPF